MIEDAVAARLADTRQWFVEQHLIEREAALEAFIAADRQRVAEGLADARSRYPGFDGALVPYLANQNADRNMPFVRLPSASKRLRVHVERATDDAFHQMARKAAGIEDRLNIAKCDVAVSTLHGFTVAIQVEPTGGGRFGAWVNLRFHYGIRTGSWRPMVIMTLGGAELPDGSRPRSLIGPRILRAFFDLQSPKPEPAPDVVDEREISDL